MPNSSAPVHTESNSKQIVYKDIPFYMPFDFKIVKKIFSFQKFEISFLHFQLVFIFWKLF